MKAIKKFSWHITCFPKPHRDRTITTSTNQLQAKTFDNTQWENNFIRQVLMRKSLKQCKQTNSVKCGKLDVRNLVCDVDGGWNIVFKIQ